jgi:hypothetical protein
MALIIEDGTGKVDAQSYAEVATLETYAALYGVTLAAADDAAKEVLLVKAMLFIESQSFKGMKSTQAQALQYPRYNVCIDGYLISNDVIPNILINAQCETAISIDTGTDPMDDISRVVTREKIGALEFEYQKGGRVTTYIQKAESLLSKLTHSHVTAVRG